MTPGDADTVTVAVYSAAGTFLREVTMPLRERDGLASAADALDAQAALGFTWLPIKDHPVPLELMTHGKLRTR